MTNHCIDKALIASKRQGLLVVILTVCSNFGLSLTKLAPCHYFSRQVIVFSPVRLQKPSGRTQKFCPVPPLSMVQLLHFLIFLFERILYSIFEEISPNNTYYCIDLILFCMSMSFKLKQ
jgi:hypothetical protein